MTVLNDDDDNTDRFSEASEAYFVELSENFSGKNGQEEHYLTTSRQSFRGVIYERINSTQMKSYFQLSVSKKYHYRY